MSETRSRPSPIASIDQVQRALLAHVAVCVPEIGTTRAETPPTVVITSNRTREVHDAPKRHCLYHWIAAG
jgi:MoxR-like ATPase